MIRAHCYLRGEERSFVVTRIESAVLLDTGEIIDDVAELLGLPSTKPPPLTRQRFLESPRRLSTEEAQRQRKKDKADLFRRFKAPVIAEIAKRRLFDLFDRRCFHCGTTFRLQLDHHVPQYLGGRLVPGNVVILCANCNSDKRDRHPNEFYSHEQLQALEKLLNAELEIFDFQFDWIRWNGHRDQYLLALGASPEFVREVMTDETSPFFSGPRAESDSEHNLVISITLDDVLRASDRGNKLDE
ncbi:MAG: hypothetical protein AzoDbin1_04433 [Azoarcus sp.]|nr:hypothetical protein [Azoarcus sp.]